MIAVKVYDKSPNLTHAYQAMHIQMTIITIGETRVNVGYEYITSNR